MNCTESLHAPNVTYHGYPNTGSSKLRRVLEIYCCFISPSCSEGISTASTTMLQAGLFPVMSRNNGIDLPSGCGIYLEDCSVEEIVQRVKEIAELPATELRGQNETCQATTLETYSRNKFTRDVSAYLHNHIAGQIKD